MGDYNARMPLGYLRVMKDYKVITTNVSHGENQLTGEGKLTGREAVKERKRLKHLDLKERR